MMESNSEQRKRRRKAWMLLPLVALVLGLVAVVLDGDGNKPGTGNEVAEQPGSEVLGKQLEGEQEQALGPAKAPGAPAKPDKAAPSVSVAFPVSGGAYSAAAWDAGCTPAGACGKASDPSGVDRVEISIRQLGSGRWWNGTAFDSSTEAFHHASGASPWTYGFARPADGSYRVAARATDASGNTSGRRTVNFSIDTVPPSTPVIERHPEDVTFDSSAEFRFSNSESGVTYRCQLDGAPPAPCDRQSNFRSLDPGDHTLLVWAVDAAGNQSVEAASFSWTIAPRRDFVVDDPDGGVGTSSDNLLSPGRSMSLDTVVSNPFRFPLRVIDIAVTVTGATKGGQPNPACAPGENLVITNSSFAGPVVVPANSSRSLSELGVPEAQWPQLQMLNLSTNQDACKNTTFQLSYQGTGTKS